MAELRTHEEVRAKIVGPLMSIAGELSKLCDKWQRAFESGKMSRPDLLLNEAMSVAAIEEHLPRFAKELDRKVDEAERGVYRYRDDARGENRKEKS